MAEGFAPVDECDVFDVQVAELATFACPAVRISPQLVALDGKLYLAGGSMLGAGEPTPNASIEVYDPGYGSWSTLVPEIPIELTPSEYARLSPRTRLVLEPPRG